MQSLAREDYLATEIMTATPQKLQLMLIDAGIRCIERTRRHWESQQYEEACETLGRAQDVVGELLSSLNHEAGSDLVKKMAAIYVCVLRHLAEAGYGRDVEKLAGALKILEVERETWRQVCEKYGSAGQHDPAGRLDSLAPTVSQPPASHVSRKAAELLDLAQPFAGDSVPCSGFSWEA